MKIPSRDNPQLNPNNIKQLSQDSITKSYMKKVGHGAQALGGTFFDPSQSTELNEIKDTFKNISEAFKKDTKSSDEMVDLQKKTLHVLESNQDYKNNIAEDQKHKESIDEMHQVNVNLEDQNQIIVRNQSSFEKELKSLRLKKAEIDRKKEYFQLKKEIEKFNKSDESRSFGDRKLKDLLYKRNQKELTQNGQSIREYKKVSSWQESIENEKLFLMEKQLEISTKLLEAFTGNKYSYAGDGQSEAMKRTNEKIQNEYEWATANAFKALLKEQANKRGSAINLFGLGTVAKGAKQKIFGVSKKEQTKQLELEAQVAEDDKQRKLLNQSVKQTFMGAVSPIHEMGFNTNGQTISVKVSNVLELGQQIGTSILHKMATGISDAILLPDETKTTMTPQGTSAFRAEEIANKQKKNEERQTKLLKNIEDAIIVGNKINKKDLEVSKDQLSSTPGLFSRIMEKVFGYGAAGAAGGGGLGIMAWLKGGSKAIKGTESAGEMGYFATKIAKVKKIIGGITNFFSKSGKFGKLFGSVGRFFTNVGKFFQKFKFLGKFVKLGGKLLGKIMVPLMAIFAAFDFKKGWEKAKSIIEKKTASLKEKFEAGLSSAISGFLFGIISPKTIYKIIHGIDKMITSPLKFISDGVDYVGGLVTGLFKGIFNAIKKLKGYTDFMIDWVSGMYNTTKTIVKTIYNAGKTIILGISNLIGIKKYVSKIFDSVEWLFGTLTSIVLFPVKLIEKVIGFLYDSVQYAIDSVDNISNFFTHTIPMKLKGIRNKIYDIYKSAKDKIDKVIESAGNALSFVKEKVINLATAAWNVLKKLAIAIITSPFNTILAFAKVYDIAKETKDYISKKFNELVDYLFGKGKIRKAIGFVKDKIGYVLTAPFDMLAEMWKKLDMALSISNAVKKLFKTVKDEIKKALKKVKDVIAHPLDAAKKGISNVYHKVWSVNGLEPTERAKAIQRAKDERTKKRKQELQILSNIRKNSVKKNSGLYFPTSGSSSSSNSFSNFNFGTNGYSSNELSSDTAGIGGGVTIGSGSSGDALPTATAGAIDTKDLGHMAFAAPATSGVITSPYGPRNIDYGSSPHKGIDMRGAIGDPTLSMADGVVEKIGSGSIQIRHSNGLVTRYMHLSAILVKKGQKVLAGQQIGKIGKLHTKTPHLHFEVWENGVKKDPLTFLKRVIPGYNPKLAFGGSQASAKRRVANATKTGGNFSFFDKIKKAFTPKSYVSPSKVTSTSSSGKGVSLTTGTSTISNKSPITPSSVSNDTPDNGLHISPSKVTSTSSSGKGVSLTTGTSTIPIDIPNSNVPTTTNPKKSKWFGETITTNVKSTTSSGKGVNLVTGKSKPTIEVVPQPKKSKWFGETITTNVKSQYSNIKTIPNKSAITMAAKEGQKLKKAEEERQKQVSVLNQPISNTNSMASGTPQLSGDLNTMIDDPFLAKFVDSTPVKP